MEEERPKRPLIIEGRGLIKDFTVGKKQIRVLKGLNFLISEGEFVMISGPSGCGKSTLMNILNGWDGPTEGIIKVDGVNFFELSENKRAIMLRPRVGMVHQAAFWVKSLSVADNVGIPFLLSGKTKKEARDRANELLQMLGLSQFAHYKPMDLSGGQQQRISLIRSLINNPKIILADEPTGNLDSRSSELLMQLFKAINEELGRTIVMVTHNLELLPYASKVIFIKDGILTNIEVNRLNKQESLYSKDILDLTSNNFLKEDKESEEEERERAQIR